VREAVVSLIYAQDIGNEKIEKFMDEMLEDKKIRNKQKEFALSLYKGINDNLKAIDQTLSTKLQEWKLDELGHIERAILRLGTYELLFADIDNPVAINEAVDLAKELSADSAPKFINGVLDSISKDLS
jgi:N utilization substance protein B